MSYDRRVILLPSLINRPTNRGINQSINYGKQGRIDNRSRQTYTQTHLPPIATTSAIFSPPLARRGDYDRIQYSPFLPSLDPTGKRPRLAPHSFHQEAVFERVVRFVSEGRSASVIRLAFHFHDDA